MQFIIQPGYKGMCAGPCDGERDGEVEVFVKFDTPLDTHPDLFPAVTGVRVYMCRQCAAQHESEEQES